MAREFWCVYHSWLPALSALSDAECGRLFRCALQYSAAGEEAELPGNERFTWPLIRSQIDRDTAKYNAKIESLRKAGRTSADKRQQMLANVDKCQLRKEKEEEKEKGEEESIPPNPPQGGHPSPSSKRFIPPTLDEIRAYCLERKNAVDPDRFFSYYTSNGWRVGKNPMKDWQAAVRTWERSEPSFSRPAAGTSRNVQTASCLSEEDQIRKYGPLPSVDHLQDLIDKI